jgi:hypothetical protein
MKPPIFILGAGRSGTTLIQRLLNSYDDIMIWGEHGGFLKDTAASFFSLLEDRGSRKFHFATMTNELRPTLESLLQKKDPNVWQAWINWFKESDVHAIFRQHVESFFRHPAMGDDFIWGFKEIRYGNQDRVIEFLSRLYPDAVFVFISRNGYDTVASQLKTFWDAGRLRRALALRYVYRTGKDWSEQNRHLLEWHTSGKLRSFWVRYEDLTTRLEALNPLLAALGKSVSARQHEVLEMENGRGSSFNQDTVSAPRWQTMTWLQLMLTEMALGSVNRALQYESPYKARWLSALAGKAKLNLDSYSETRVCSTVLNQPQPNTSCRTR